MATMAYYEDPNLSLTNGAGSPEVGTKVQAYGTDSSHPGTISFKGLPGSKAVDAMFVAGYNATPGEANIMNNDGKGALKLEGINTFSGNLVIKAATINSKDSSTLATVNLDGVNFVVLKNDAIPSIGDKISMNISGESSIHGTAMGSDTYVIVNGDVTLKDGAVLGAGTDVELAGGLALDENATATLKDGAKVKHTGSTNISVHENSALNVVDNASLTTSKYLLEEGTINVSGNATVAAGYILIGKYGADVGEMNVTNATVQSNDVIVNYGTTNLTAATLKPTAIFTNNNTVNVFSGTTKITTVSGSSVALQNNGILNLKQGAYLDFDGYATKLENGKDSTINLQGGTVASDVVIENKYRGIVNWDLSVGAGNESQINWTQLINAGTLAITVDAAAKVGDTYMLADDAAVSAGNSFTLKGAGYADTITVGADLAHATSVSYGGVDYTLVVDSGDLVLSVSASTAATIKEYQGGMAGVVTKNDAYTFYTKESKIAASAFENPGKPKGAVSYKYMLDDYYVGPENAKTEYDWDSATTLTGTGVDIAGVDDGKFKIVVLAGFDTAGNIVSVNFYQVLKDKTLPTPTADLTNSTGIYTTDTWSTSVVNVSVKVSETETDDDPLPEGGVAPSGIKERYVSMDGGTKWTLLDETKTSLPVTEEDSGDTGKTDIMIKSIDKAGNEKVESVGTVKVDTTKATLSNIAVSATGDKNVNGWYNESNGTISITGKAYDKTSGVDEVKYSTDAGSNWTAATGTTDWTISDISETSGTDYLFKVYDVAGNVNDDSSYKLDSLKIDKTKASATITISPESASETGWYNIATGAPTYTIVATDDLSGVWKIDYQIDGGAWTNLYTDETPEDAEKSVTKTLDVADTGTGAKSYTFRITDVAGNETEQSTVPSSVKVDTIAPIMTGSTYDVKATNAKTYDWSGTTPTEVTTNPMPMTDGLWITNRRNAGGTGTFTFGGTITAATDGGSPITPKITITFEYNEWDPIKNEWTGEKQNTTYTYSKDSSDWTWDSGTGNWTYKLPVSTIKNAAGNFKIEVGAIDEAGNESTSTSTFEGHFDNTIPSDPKVTLAGGTVESDYIHYLKEGEENSLKITATDVKLADKGTITQSTVRERYWATTKGALDKGTIFSAAEKKGDDRVAGVPTEITAANVDTYWTDAVTDGVINEDAYNIAFYDQNETGTYSAGQSDYGKMSYARFIVDRSAPILGTVDAPTGASAKDASGNDWFDEAGVTVTFKAVDAWKGTDTSAGYEDHVSGINKFYVKNGETWEETTEVTKTITTAGDNTYTFKADDKAGNLSNEIEATYRIDTAAPTYDSVVLTGFVGEDKLLGGAKTVYINAADLEGVTGDVTAKVSNVRDTYDTAKDGGVGIDRTVAHTYFTIDGGTATEFTVDGTTDYTSALQALADGEHTITVHYEDKLVAAGTATLANHTKNASYTFTKDVTKATITVDTDLADSYTTGIKFTNGGTDAPINEPKAVTATLDGAAYVSRDLQLTIGLNDATSGLDTYKLTAADGTVIKSMSGLAGVATATIDLASAELSAYENKGAVSYTLEVTDMAGNVTTESFTYNYDTVATGDVAVKNDDGTSIKVNADGKYYVNTTDYKISYTQDDKGSGNGNLYFLSKGDSKWYLGSMDTGAQSVGWEGTDGSAFNHQAYISDKASNLKDVGVTVEVDTTKAAITLKSGVTATMFTAPTGAPSAANASGPNAAEMYAGKDLTANGGYSSSYFSALDSDFVITISDKNLSSVIIDGTEIYQSGTSVEYTINKSSLDEGANTRVITATDKAGNVTTSTITLNYDSEAPEFGTQFITVDGSDRSEKGGTTQELAEAKAIYVNDISKFAVTLTATDTSTVTSYYSFSEDFTGSWSAWETIPATLTTGEGYYRFAEVDAAGNSTLTENYYFITSDKGDPANPYVTFTVGDELVNFSTKDGDNQMTYQGAWYDKDVTVDFTFTNQIDGSDETHYYIASDKFDKAAWDKAYAKAYDDAIKAGKSVADASSAARRAAIDVIAWDGSVKTDKTTNTKASAQLVATKTTSYYFISVDEAENTSRLQEVTVNIDKLGTGGIVTLDGKALDSEKITWSNENGRVTVTLGESGESVRTLEYTTDGSTWKLISLATKSFTLPEGTYENLKIRVTDKFGNEKIADYKAGVDRVDPTATITGYTTETWTKDNVTLSIAYADDRSGVATKGLEEELVEAADGEVKMVTKTYTVTDNAGNIGVSSINVYIDKAAPSVSVTALTADGLYVSDTWAKNAVTAFVTATDLGSGIATDPTGNFTYGVAGEVFNETLTYKAIDKVGNEGTASITVKIDKQAPTISDVTASATTWTKDDVTVTATLADGEGSGIAGSESYEQKITAESATKAGTKVTIEALDNVGNKTTQDVTVYIDKTAPTVDVDLGDGKWSSEVTVTATFDDALSGVASRFYKKDGGEWTAYEEAGVKFTETGTIQFKALDNAGNELVSKVYNVTNIDTDKPTLDVTLWGTEGEWKTIDGVETFVGKWTNQDVDVRAKAKDDVSGIDYYKSNLANDVQYTVEGKDRTFTYKAVDGVGHETEKTVIVSIDKTAAKIETSYDGKSGWNKEAVTVTATATDNLSGFGETEEKTLVLESQTTKQEGLNTLTFEATDNAGNKTTKTVKVFVDTVAPELTVDTYGYESGTWTNEDVQIVASATDAGAEGVLTSGVDFEKSALTNAHKSTKDGDRTFTFYAYDKAGNKSEEKTVNVKIDKTAPTIERTDSYEGGWVNKAEFEKMGNKVTVSATAADALSGLKDASKATQSVDVTAEGLTTVKFDAEDQAGNTVEKKVRVLVDTVAPELTVTAKVGDKDVDGKWTNQDVKIKAAATDATSGLVNWSDTRLTHTEEGVKEISYTAKDVAGNETTDSVTVKIDKTAAEITTSYDGKKGWNKEAVTVTASATDDASGFGTAGEQGVLTKDLASWTASEEGVNVHTFEVTDTAGNKTEKTVKVLVDTKAPELAVNTYGYESGKWTNKDVMLKATATDATSGVDFENSKLADSMTLTVDQNVNVKFYATDVAGNKSAEETVNVKIDKTAAEITTSYDGQKGWNKEAVTVTASATDNLSGFGATESKTLDLGSQVANKEGLNELVFEATDNAGNKTTKKVNVLVDTVAPELAVNAQVGDKDVDGKWTNQDVKVWATATDATSGLVNWSDARLTHTEEGVKEISYTAKDAAGNETTDSVTVKIDKTAAKITTDYDGIKPGTWNAKAVTVAASATDDASGFGTAGEQGVLTKDLGTQVANKEGVNVLTFTATDTAGNVAEKKVTVLVDTEAPELDVTAKVANKDVNGKWTNKDVAIVATAKDATSGVVDWSDKDYTMTEETRSAGKVVKFTAKDAAGNDVTKEVTVKIDKTAAEITTSYDGKKGWNKEAVKVTATATDNLSGFGEAGEQGELTKELKSWTASEEGVNVHTFEVTDTAGNKTEKTVKVLVDTVAPELDVTAKVANKDVNGKWTNKDVAIVATAKDATSGVVDWSDKDYTMTEETRSAGKVVEFTAKDAAGNDVTKEVTVKIDKTAAEIETSYDGKSGWNTQAVKVTATATDNLSGFGEAGEQGELTKELKSWTASEQGLNVHTFEVTDTAGNKTEKTVKVLVDTVAPELTITTYGVTGEWTNKDVQIYATATDATSGVDFEKSVLTNSTKASMEQDSVYTYVAYDKAGNKSAEKTVVVKIDKTAAEIATSVDAVAAGTWFNKNTVADVTATATDNLSGFDAKGTLEKNLETWQKTSFVEGVNEHTFTVTDVAGNETEKTVTILVDTVGATFDIAKDSAMLTTGGVVLSVSNIYDATSGVDKIYWKNADAASWQEYAFEIDKTDEKSPVFLNAGVTVTEDGTYEFKVVDKAGNETIKSIEIENIVDPEEKTVLVIEDGETVQLKPGDVFEYEKVMVKQGGTLIADKNQYDKMMLEHILTSEGKVIVNPAAANVLTQYSVDQLVGQGSVVDVQFNEAMIDIGKMKVSTAKFGEEGLVVSFENGYGTQAADAITFAADANVTFGQAGYIVDLWKGANKVTVEKNATVNFLADLANAATISVTAGAAVKSADGTFQDFTVANFADISFSDESNESYYEGETYVSRNAAMTTGKYTVVTTGDITGYQFVDESFRTYKLTVGANATFAAGDITELRNISVTAGAKHAYEAVDGSFKKGAQGVTAFTAGDVDMTAVADTLSLGAFTDVKLGALETFDGNDTLSIGADATFTATSIDLGAGTDKFTVGARSTVTVGDVFGTQAVTTGAESDVTFGEVKHLDTLSIGADAEFAATKIAFGNGSSDKLTVGAGAEAKIGVGVDLEGAAITGLKSLAVTSGKDGEETVLEAGNVTMLADKANTVSLGNFTDVKLGEVAFGDLNDTLSIGADATFAAAKLDFGSGTADKLTVGARAEATVETTIEGVQTLAVTAGKAATKTAEAVYTKLTAGDVTMNAATADALTIGNYAEVTLGDVTTGDLADKLTVGNYDQVELGKVSLGDGNDVFKIGTGSTVTAESLDFGEGTKDELSIGAGSVLRISGIGEEGLDLDSLDKLTIGAGGRLVLASEEDALAAQEKFSKYSSQITYIA